MLRVRATARRLWNSWIGIWRGSPFDSDLPMQGEHRVARVRFLVIGTLSMIGILVLPFDPDNPDFTGSLPINLSALAAAFLMLLATRRGNRPPLLGVATVVGDVSAVTVVLAADLVRGLPSVVLNSRVTFSAYLLAMLGTCLRFSPWLAVLSGCLAAAQYGALVYWGIRIWPAVPTDDVIQHGTYALGVQIVRMGLLVVFGSMCASIASWAANLRSSATHDLVTGLLNRRTFEEQLHGQLLRAQRSGSPLAVAMIDVDHFKRVNDVYGHHVGDLALQTVGDIIRATLRQTDLAGRWGGEEFALAFPGEDAVSATRLLERLRLAVESRAIVVPGGATLTLTISGGVAAAPRDGPDGAILNAIADRRLFEAKQGGRNRVVGDPWPSAAR